MIVKLNKDIEDEYLRLAMERSRPVPITQESRISKWLGVKYLTGSDTKSLHSSTAFIEFSSLTAKQIACQCNLTGKPGFLEVQPVPQIGDIHWDNAHVSRSLIQTRRAWANLGLAGGLIGWSYLVTVIRSYDGYSTWVKWDVLQIASVAALINVYLPALVIEGLVRMVPILIQKVVCVWIRFKSYSEADNFVLIWYFCYRLLTFGFIIIGASIVSLSDRLIRDPM